MASISGRATVGKKLRMAKGRAAKTQHPVKEVAPCDLLEAGAGCRFHGLSIRSFDLPKQRLHTLLKLIRFENAENAGVNLSLSVNYDGRRQDFARPVLGYKLVGAEHNRII